MEEPETKTCSNCKREIPAVNFMIHSVHCARNIRVCPVCKEPVPVSDLQKHHEQMHKLLPCKKCGEQVCGTDLEDHVRDSCAHTIQTCKFCELELPRRDLPAHEAYCGVRTEQCAECREWVMFKYRQLHLDSNHGFLRLDDEEPAPPKKEVAKVTRIPVANIPTATAAAAVAGPSTSEISRSSTSSANGSSASSTNSDLTRNNNPGVRNLTTSLRSANRNLRATEAAASTSGIRNTRVSDTAASSSTAKKTEGHKNTNQIRERAEARHRALLEAGSSHEQKLCLKRTNDQPQVNTNVKDASKDSQKKMFHKKRQAPRPPPEARRDLPYYSAMQRQQDEERRRQQQTAINLAQGLPPVLSAAAKLEKLRKMDALHNRETSPPRRIQPGPSAHALREQVHNVSPDNREDLRNLQPMSPEQFMRRFHALRLDGAGDSIRGERAERGEQAAQGGNDRFSEIKTSLHALRRGLNEVTAPYNSNMLAGDPVANERQARTRQDIEHQMPRGWGFSSRSWLDFGSSSSSDDVDLSERRARTRQDMQQQMPRGWGFSDRSCSDSGSSSSSGDVELPCEFCGRLQPLGDLVQHQTGCRPDLAQLMAQIPAPSEPAPRTPQRTRRTQPQPPQPQPQPQLPQMPHADPHDLPVIPCEFCTESLPVYLISEHQERCRRDANPLYLD